RSARVVVMRRESDLHIEAENIVVCCSLQRGHVPPLFPGVLHTLSSLIGSSPSPWDQSQRPIYASQIRHFSHKFIQLSQVAFVLRKEISNILNLLQSPSLSVPPVTLNTWRSLTQPPCCRYHYRFRSIS
ncbi:unnamed protein product, partial [Sphenostylis stenocarpa]